MKACAGASAKKDSKRQPVRRASTGSVSAWLSCRLPRLVESFQKTFRVPEWVIGRYHIFDLQSRLAGGHELDVVQTR